MVLLNLLNELEKRDKRRGLPLRKLLLNTARENELSVFISQVELLYSKESNKSYICALQNKEDAVVKKRLI